ncbi:MULTISPECIES: 4-hydroxy-tetrahydrodipicolinate synthase [unclassified Janthinobacterium]|uniref:4-hydroxy-tetrahydrodipicolinate synthase n=1 Tax=unclassified Janthinobacterium TaxID=2610881 RepID=UPI0018CB7203|nr:4-hydroxy-tetrahydrodipicolinate synthase [Janthinobacterium sp. CG_23.4]MDH6159583.1 4-hydroxy-tetrahydrodipicolinate synthase [Janthinobacterium sp. CG_23.4]
MNQYCCEQAMSSSRITAHFQGIWVPMVTPFCEGELDLAAAQQLASELASSGVDGLVVCGTTGEAAMLSAAEQSMLLDSVLEAVGPRFPVVMGIGGSDTRSVVAAVQRYHDHPLAALLISAPSYVRPSQDGIVRHFQAIADATDHSIVLYNVPARTGVNIEAQTAALLARDSHFVAIKEAGGKLQQLAELLLETRLDVLCGDDTVLLASLSMGGHGAMSAAAQIRPDLYAQLYHLVKQGRHGAAGALFKTMLPLIRLLFSEPNPGPLKAALAMQGKVRDELRLPMTPMSRAGQDSLAEALDALMELPTWTASDRDAPREGCVLQLVCAANLMPAVRQDDHRHHG